MFRSQWFRLPALLAVLVTAFSLSAVDLAQARFGGSFGNRGIRTHQTVPSTPTAPGITQPVAKSTAPTTASRPGVNTQANRPGFFNGMGGWFVGSLIFGGLFGLMFGTGFGGFGGLIALIVQVLVIALIFRLLFRGFAPRPVTAGGPRYDGSSGPSGTYSRSSSSTRAGRSGSRASQRAGSRDEIGLGDRDLATFERRLSQLQDAYSREDADALRRITTPDVFTVLANELRELEAKGLRNEVYDVKLLGGDIAEAWREGPSDYATVALHYESRDIMRDRTTGALVSGEDRIIERREVWTFVRHNGSDWLLSAIQS
jgi:predicted lipid-binding transport protein (Tim44 family)